MKVLLLVAVAVFVMVSVIGFVLTTEASSGGTGEQPGHVAHLVAVPQEQ